jgi:hypothetical protein
MNSQEDLKIGLEFTQLFPNFQIQIQQNIGLKQEYFLILLLVLMLGGMI